jgi:hypothetical protein
MSHVVLHPTPLPTAITQIYALIIAVHWLATLVVVVAERLLFSLGRGHFGGVLLAPFGATVLEPDLTKNKKENFKVSGNCRSTLEVQTVQQNIWVSARRSLFNLQT